MGKPPFRPRHGRVGQKSPRHLRNQGPTASETERAADRKIGYAELYGGAFSPEPDFTALPYLPALHNFVTVAMTEANPTAQYHMQALLHEYRGENLLVLGPQGNPAWRHFLAAFLPTLPELIEQRRDLASQHRIETLVDHFFASDNIDEEKKEFEFQEAQMRAQFLARERCLTSREVAALAGHTATNTAATAARWKSQGRIFAVNHGARDLFPAFQFASDGSPHPAIAKVLAIFAAKKQPWSTAFWFASNNGWLPHSAMPKQCLDDEAALLNAARQEAEPVIG